MVRSADSKMSVIKVGGTRGIGAAKPVLLPAPLEVMQKVSLCYSYQLLL